MVKPTTPTRPMICKLQANMGHLGSIRCFSTQIQAAAQHRLCTGKGKKKILISWRTAKTCTTQCLYLITQRHLRMKCQGWWSFDGASSMTTSFYPTVNCHVSWPILSSHNYGQTKPSNVHLHNPSRCDSNQETRHRNSSLHNPRYNCWTIPHRRLSQLQSASTYYLNQTRPQKL